MEFADGKTQFCDNEPDPTHIFLTAPLSRPDPWSMRHAGSWVVPNHVELCCGPSVSTYYLIINYEAPTPLVNTLASVTTSYGSLGNVPPVEIAHVHQFSSFYLRTYFYYLLRIYYLFTHLFLLTRGSGRLLVNTTHFPVSATDSQSFKLA